MPANAPFGHCPKCLLDLGFGPLQDQPEAPAPNPGGVAQTIGDYELLERIGRGGMGVVYKARQIALNRFVALKLISAGEFASPHLIQRFHREAEAAANLNHPNIVPIYETGELNGQHFYSMHLIDGVGLDRHISRDGFSFGQPKDGAGPTTRVWQEQIARIMLKVARAVEHAHQHGVLHRDLKPGNIILDQDGEPHLTDFGVAKLIEGDSSGLTASGAVIGTPSYMAPEQAAGAGKRITTAGDIYSLGAVLYTMLTGDPPFRANTPVETLRQVVDQEPKHPSTLIDGLDADLSTIAMKCLEKEPQRRYASASALAEELERWLRKEPILARPVSTGERFWRWCRRNPKLAAFATATATLLLVIAVGSTLAAIHFAKLQRLGEDQRQQIRKNVTADLNELWQRGGDQPVMVNSETRRLLTNMPTLPLILPRLTFGVYTHTKPADMLERFSPVLNYLETDAGVIIDLSIYRGYSNATVALASGSIQLARPGPASYVIARRADPGIHVLVKQLHKGEAKIRGFIFTSNPRFNGVANLAGCKFAFADPESTFGNLKPKLKLMEVGIFATNLTACCTHINAHDAVVEAVISGKFDAGAANANYVQKANEKGANLKVLATMESVSFPWIASSGLDPDLRRRIQQSLLKLKHRGILSSIDRDLDGFIPAAPADYNEFEQEMEKEKRFGE